MPKRSSIFCLVLLAAVLLAACGAAEPAATATPVPTDTPAAPPTPEAFVPEGRPALSAGNIASAAVFQTYSDHVGVAFAPDGAFMVLQGSTLAEVNLTTGESADLVELEGQYYSTAVSSDGQYIAYVAQGDDGPVTRIWDREAGDVAAEGPLTRFGLAFIPETSILVMGDNRVPMLDAASGEPVEHSLPQRSTPSTLAVWPDGSMILQALNGFVVFDDAETYENIKSWDFTAEIEGTTVAPSIDALAISADGSRVAVALNAREERAQLRAIQIWDAAADGALHEIPFEAPDNFGARAAAFSPDGALLAVGFDDGNFAGHVAVYDAESGEKLTDLEAPSGVYHLAFSPDGALLAVGTTQRGGLVLYTAGEA